MLKSKQNISGQAEKYTKLILIVEKEREKKSISISMKKRKDNAIPALHSNKSNKRVNISRE